MAVVALGNKAEPVAFYAPLTEVSNQPSSAVSAAVNAESLSLDISSTAADNCLHHLQSSNLSMPSSSDTNEKESVLGSVILLLQEKHRKFGSTLSGLQTMHKRVRRVQTPGQWQWESFLHTIGSAVPLARRQHAAIRVQPTALNRRRPGVTRGSKRLPPGRPGKSVHMVQAKRRRNLQVNVDANQPNAKSHGSSH